MILGADKISLRCAVALLACALAQATVQAQDKPSLKELLNRAQSDLERKAVEDLIGKLQGKAGQPNQPLLETPPAAGGKPAGQDRDDGGTVERAAATPAPETPSEQHGATEKPPSSEADQTAATKPTPQQEPVTASQEREGPAGVAAKSPSPDAGEKAAAPQASSQPSSGSERQSPDEGPKVAAQPAASPDLVVEKAERKELPSVDLEVTFEFDSAELTTAAVETLTTLGRALVDERLAGNEFLIGGHTDAKGRADYNLRLSERRAAAVRQFLIATFGIDGSRLTARGFGERYLKNPRLPRAEENRRVQIVNVSRQQAR